MAIIIVVAVAIIAGIDHEFSMLRPDRFAFYVTYHLEKCAFLDQVDKSKKNLSGLGLVIHGFVVGKLGFSMWRPDRFALYMTYHLEKCAFLGQVDKSKKNLSGLGLLMFECFTLHLS